MVLTLEKNCDHTGKRNKDMLKVKIITKKFCVLEVGGEAGVAVNVQRRQWLSQQRWQHDDIITESCQITWTK